MAQMSRWLAYSTLLMVLPIVAWKLFQGGIGGLPEHGRPGVTAAPVEQQSDRSSARARGVASRAGERDGARMRSSVRRAALYAPAMEQGIVGDMTATDFQTVKADYSCDLALTARQECNAAYEDADAYEMCLSLRQYYSYSRHCGYQP